MIIFFNLNFFEIGSQLAQTGSQFSAQLKMTLNFRSFCHHLPSAGMTCTHHHLVYAVLRIVPRVSCILDKHSIFCDNPLVISF